jgi:vitamin B12 transporter
VHRFHDGYRALGANLEAGWRGRPWANRLLLRGFFTDTDQDIQHDAVMTVPYGGVVFGERTAGGILRYALSFGDGWSLDSVLGYAFVRSRLMDVDTCAHDWFGRCVVERRPGELEPGNPRDAVNWEHALYARAQLGWEPLPGHALLLAVSPSLSSRSGDDRLDTDPAARDPLNAQRDLLSLVNGIEYTLSAFADRLENRLFVKQYVQLARSEAEVARRTFVERDRDTHRYGFGSGLRFRLTEQLYAKASYEWATRLPSPDEVFGDNALVRPYLELRPEVSHNANVGLGNARRSRSGELRGEVMGFWREANDLIVELAEELYRFYRNVYSARSLGVEASAGWTAPGGWIALDVNATYQSFRNTSDAGLFVTFEGDRIPNRPWLFGNAAVRLSERGVFAPDDELALISYARYVHDFLRGWESIGVVEYKRVVPGYVLTSLGASYTVASGPGELSSSLELANLTDRVVQDFYGVQRPGRTVSAKLTARY